MGASSSSPRDQQGPWNGGTQAGYPYWQGRPGEYPAGGGDYDPRRPRRFQQIPRMDDPGYPYAGQNPLPVPPKEPLPRLHDMNSYFNTQGERRPNGHDRQHSASSSRFANGHLDRRDEQPKRKGLFRSLTTALTGRGRDEEEEEEEERQGPLFADDRRRGKHAGRLPGHARGRSDMTADQWTYPDGTPFMGNRPPLTPTRSHSQYRNGGARDQDEPQSQRKRGRVFRSFSAGDGNSNLNGRQYRPGYIPPGTSNMVLSDAERRRQRLEEERMTHRAQTYIPANLSNRQWTLPDGSPYVPNLNANLSPAGGGETQGVVPGPPLAGAPGATPMMMPSQSNILPQPPQPQFPQTPGSQFLAPSQLNPGLQGGSVGEPFYFERSHPFSHVSAFPVHYDNKIYPTAYHLWEAMKYIDARPDIASRIRKCGHKARDVSNFLKTLDPGDVSAIRPDWEQVMFAKMDEVLYLKFTQREDLRTQLLALHPKPMIYLSKRDTFWGAISFPPNPLEGRNELGKSLERVRGRILMELGGMGLRHGP